MPGSVDTRLLFNLAAAVLIGALVGVEREKSKGRSGNVGIGGLRHAQERSRVEQIQRGRIGGERIGAPGVRREALVAGALRDGALGAVAGRGENKGKAGKKGAEALPRVLLFNVEKDPKETTDLAAREPERVKSMTAALDAWMTSVERSLAGADYAAAGK